MRTAGRSLAAFRRGALVRQDGGRIQHDPGGVSHRGAGQRVLESREWRVVLRRASPHDLSGDFGCVPPVSILDCEQDWNVWHPEYDKKLGPPTANATVTGAKYHRSFGSGTTVDLDLSDPKHPKSCIRWSDGDTTGADCAHSRKKILQHRYVTVEIGAGRCDVTKYGAVGDGKADDVRVQQQQPPLG